MSNYNIVLVTRGLADDGGCVCRLVSMCACWMGVCVCVCAGVHAALFTGSAHKESGGEDNVVSQIRLACKSI